MYIVKQLRECFERSDWIVVRFKRRLTVFKHFDEDVIGLTKASFTSLLHFKYSSMLIGIYRRILSDTLLQYYLFIYFYFYFYRDKNCYFYRDKNFYREFPWSVWPDWPGKLICPLIDHKFMIICKMMLNFTHSYKGTCYIAKVIKRKINVTNWKMTFEINLDQMD